MRWRHTLPTCVRRRLAGQASAGRHDVVPLAVLLAGRASGACATGPMTAGSARGRGHHLPQEPGGQQAHRPGDLGGPDELDRLRGRRGGHLLHEAAQCPGGGAHEPGPVDDADPRGLGDLLGRPVQAGDPGDPGRCLLGGAAQHRHRAGTRRARGAGARRDERGQALHRPPVDESRRCALGRHRDTFLAEFTGLPEPLPVAAAPNTPPRPLRASARGQGRHEVVVDRGCDRLAGAGGDIIGQDREGQLAPVGGGDDPCQGGGLLQ